MTPVGDPKWRQVWRLHYRFLDGRREHIDAYGTSAGGFPVFAPDAGRQEMTRRHGDRGWWLEAWQPLACHLCGHPGRIGEGRRLDGPPLRRRLYVAWRRVRRALTPTPEEGTT